jgi:hypothetical protein
MEEGMWREEEGNAREREEAVRGEVENRESVDVKKGERKTATDIPRYIQTDRQTDKRTNQSFAKP